MSRHPPATRLIAQFARYAAVGVASNVALYCFYVVLTALGTEPKATMSTLYIVGMVQTFVANRHWSFRSVGPARAALMRYLTTCAVGYAVNLGILVLLVDFAGLDHRYVQAGAIALVAVLLFLMQRSWVFRPVVPG